jgi:hypothetical protein
MYLTAGSRNFLGKLRFFQLVRSFPRCYETGGFMAFQNISLLAHTLKYIKALRALPFY